MQLSPFTVVGAAQLVPMTVFGAERLVPLTVPRANQCVCLAWAGGWRALCRVPLLAACMLAVSWWWPFWCLQVCPSWSHCTLAGRQVFPGFALRVIDHCVGHQAASSQLIITCSAVHSLATNLVFTQLPMHFLFLLLFSDKKCPKYLFFYLFKFFFVGSLM